MQFGFDFRRCVDLLHCFPPWHLQAVVFKVFIWGTFIFSFWFTFIQAADKVKVSRHLSRESNEMFCWSSTLFCIWRRADTDTSHDTEDQSEVCWHHQHTSTKQADSELTPTHPAVTHKPRQAGADVGGASAVAAQSSLRNVTVMTSSLTVIHRAVLLWGRHRRQLH